MPQTANDVSKVAVSQGVGRRTGMGMFSEGLILWCWPLPDQHAMGCVIIKSVFFHGVDI